MQNDTQNKGLGMKRYVIREIYPDGSTYSITQTECDSLIEADLFIRKLRDGYERFGMTTVASKVKTTDSYQVKSKAAIVIRNQASKTHRTLYIAHNPAGEPIKQSVIPGAKIFFQDRCWEVRARSLYMGNTIDLRDEETKEEKTFHMGVLIKEGAAYLRPAP